jgi:ATP-binding cassette subfamily D (ALD) protein 4
MGKGMGGIIAYLVLGIPIFTSVYNDLTPAQLAQLISNYSFKCQYLIYLFTRLYNTLDDISSIAGNSHRVGELLDRMDENSKRPEAAVVHTGGAESVCFRTDRLSVLVPDKSKVLIKELSFTFETGRNVLVTGRSGCGKTSLLRCLNGLWSSYTGQLALSELVENKPFFLPQSSYFTSGSLLEQIIYPTIEESFLKEMSAGSFEPFLLQVKAWLRKFNLEHLLQKVSWDLALKPGFNWSAVLSAGKLVFCLLKIDANRIARFLTSNCQILVHAESIGTNCIKCGSVRPNRFQTSDPTPDVQH